MALVTARWYCNTDDLKAELGDWLTNDARRDAIAQASRSIEVHGRTFYPVTATKRRRAADGSRCSWLTRTCSALTTLTDDTGVITSTYYWLYPLNVTPKHSVVLDTGPLGRGFPVRRRSTARTKSASPGGGLR